MKSMILLVVLIVLLSPVIDTKQARDGQALPLAQSNYEHRYVIFLQGITSSSSDREHPLQDSFQDIEAYLRENGLTKFVYFSYAAATAINRGELMCAGWERVACTSGAGQALGDLSALDLSPVYSVEDTKVNIDLQADALEWLVGQIVKKDPEAEIDLLGFSLGGIIAVRWASRPGGSAYYDHIHGIATMGSPLGGIPLAGPFLDGCSIADIPCFIWKRKLLTQYGRVVGAQLQLPDYDADVSIIDDLRGILDHHEFLFVTIQSTADYTVNGKLFPLCRTIACIDGQYDSVLIGLGTQYWPPHVKHHDEFLGGLGFPAEPIYHANLDDFLSENHSATLHHPFTAQWVTEMILTPAKNIPTPATAMPVPTLEVSQELYNARGSGFVYDIVQVGETAYLEFNVLNSGQNAWAGADFTFSPVPNDNSVSLSPVTIIETVNPGETIVLETEIPEIEGISILTIEYQMTYVGQPFGDVIDGYIFILPDGVQDLEEEIRKKIDELVQQGEQEIDKLITSILEEIREAVEREARRTLEEMFRQCLGSNGALVIGVIVVYYQRKSRFRK